MSKENNLEENILLYIREHGLSAKDKGGTLFRVFLCFIRKLFKLMTFWRDQLAISYIYISVCISLSVSFCLLLYIFHNSSSQMLGQFWQHSFSRPPLSLL